MCLRILLPYMVIEFVICLHHARVCTKFQIAHPLNTSVNYFDNNTLALAWPLYPIFLLTPPEFRQRVAMQGSPVGVRTLWQCYYNSGNSSSSDFLRRRYRLLNIWLRIYIEHRLTLNIYLNNILKCL